MSRKNSGRRYRLQNVPEEVKYNYLTGQVTKRINPFANGYKDMTAMEWIQKNISEKYRRIKK